MTEQLIEELIDLAIREDIGDGDHSSQSCIPETAQGKVQLLVKEEGIIAGIEIAEKVFKKIDPDVKMDIFIKDGTRVKPGDVAFTVEGKVWTLLKTERRFPTPSPAPGF